MAVLLTTLKPAHRALDARASAQILQQAIHHRAVVNLQFQSHDRSAIASGKIADATPTILIIQLCEYDDHFPRGNTMIECRVQLRVEGADYEFDSQLFSIPGDPRFQTVSIGRPTLLQPTERRRTPRRLLRATTRIEIHQPLADEIWSASGLLLNISEKGLACRLDAREAAELRCNEKVRIHFCIGDVLEEFNLFARIASIVESASAQHAIVGMEFIDLAQALDQSKRLARALGANTQSREKS